MPDPIEVVVGENNAQITELVFTLGNTSTTQDSPDGNAIRGAGSIELTSLTVVNDDGSAITVSEFRTDAEVAPITFPDELDGVVVWQNGFRTDPSQPGFDAAVEHVFNSNDLRDYISHDDVNLDLSEKPLRVVYDEPLGAEDVVIVAERGGNSSLEVVPLDCASNVPIPTASMLMIGEPYDWDTRIAQPGFISSQSTELTAVEVSLFGATTPICGFDVSTNGSDFNFIVGSP